MKKTNYFTPLITVTAFTAQDVLNVSGNNLDNDGAFKQAWEESL